MGNKYKDEAAFIRTLRRILKRGWYRFTARDDQRGVIYSITVYEKKMREEKDGE